MESIQQHKQIEVYKFKVSYYLDDVHMYGHTICDVYCVENYSSVIGNVNNNEQHFYIKICDGTITTATSNSLPINKPAMVKLLIPESSSYRGTSIYNIGKVMISLDWVNLCYDNYKKTIELNNETDALFRSQPIVLSECDLFDNLISDAEKEFNKQNYVSALNIYIECIEKYSINPKIFTAMYNAACCYSKMDDLRNSIKYIKLAVDNGFNDWKQIIEDVDINKYKDNSNFVDIVRKMIENNPKAHYECTSIEQYLKKYNLEKLNKDAYLKQFEIFDR